MMDRRTFLASASAILLTKSGRLAAAPHGLAPEVEDDVTQWVNPLIGTGGLGHCYPGATAPFGMVQLTPDTGTLGYSHCAGYHYEDTHILGFSHTHLSGTGCGDLADALLMPGLGEPAPPKSVYDNEPSPWQSPFSHTTEQASPGYYAVTLEDSRIRAELTATERTGTHRYTFPSAEQSFFLLDLSHRIVSLNIFDRPIQHARLNLVGKDTITGSRRTDNWARGREIFFAIQFSRPFELAEIFEGSSRISGESHEVTDTPLRAMLRFGRRSQGDVILVKTAVSGVSIEGALNNLRAEMPGWDFDATRSSAGQAWMRELSRVRIIGGTPQQRRIFYTGLYHTMLAPTAYDDADGRYRGMDGEVHTLVHGERNYSTFSLWDTYRATHPLYTILQPERVPGMVNCLVRMSHESPHGVPIWPLQGKETFCMTGYRSSVVIAEALAKDFSGINAEAAYGPLRRRAMEDSYEGLQHYRRLGYIPCELEKESCSKTTDYCYNDWAVARVAEAAGAATDAQFLRQRSLNFRNLFDPQTGFIRPRLQDGSWSTPFAPNEVGHWSKWHDYTEANPWQTTFAIPHHPLALAELLGGRAALEAKLDGLFTADSTQAPDAPGSITGLIGQYAHGNEPSHHIAYLYSYAGAPWKTQQYVRRILDTMYHDAPVGTAGNEDCGQMSAWFVMSALGFYPVDPISATYVFRAPLFDRVTLNLPGSRELQIEAHRRHADDLYIESVTWNGRPHTRSWFRHSELLQGGRVVFQMASSPNRSWGSAPPSFIA